MATHKFAKPMPTEPKYKLHKLMYDLSSEDYHSIKGTYSSSQFKDLLEDTEIFVAKHINKTVEKESIPAFDVGTYFHTGVLEPHKLKSECVVYSGKVRRGEDWEKFKAKHPGKVIVTPSMRDTAEKLITLAQDSPVAMGYIKRGKPEVSLFVELWIDAGEIYAPHYGKVLDLHAGWLDFDVADHFRNRKKKPVKIIVKVRADSLGEDFVLDLKSTTGNARSASAMKGKILYYNYGLSASLYLDIFSLERGRPMNIFIWTFASKVCFNCKSFMASPSNILVGRAQYMKCVLRLAELIRGEFQLYDELGVLEPESWQLDYLKEKETD